MEKVDLYGTSDTETEVESDDEYENNKKGNLQRLDAKKDWIKKEEKRVQIKNGQSR